MNCTKDAPNYKAARHESIQAEPQAFGSGTHVTCLACGNSWDSSVKPTPEMVHQWVHRMTHARKD